jgi:hypothetical protein
MNRWSAVHILYHFRLLPHEKSPKRLLDTSAFEAPDPNDIARSPQTQFNEFCFWLLKTVDEVCLPLVSVSVVTQESNIGYV